MATAKKGKAKNAGHKHVFMLFDSDVRAKDIVAAIKKHINKKGK